jgi:endonuclease/exonuclease/phosphatase family metal-dependent hydrolase
MRRRACTTLLLLTLAALGCAQGRNYPGAGPRFHGPGELGSPADTLRIVTFNIQFSQHVDEAIHVLRDTPELRTADVIALQEMDEQGTRRISKALEMYYVYYPATVHPHHGRNFGNAILARWPIENDRKLILPNVERFRKTQRIAVTGVIRPRGRPIRIYSTHLATALEMGPTKRREQAAAIVADAASNPEPVVVAGDMNSHGVGRVLLHAGYAWPTENQGPTRLFFDWDHIFLRGLRAAGRDSVGVAQKREGASDHKAVWVVAVLDSAAALEPLHPDAP